MRKALFLDCDGVIADTERDGHRVAFNRAFERFGFSFVWDTGVYGRLLAVAGGKERMRFYFDEAGWPVGTRERDPLIQELHALKTSLFMELIESRSIPLRSGIRRLIDEAAGFGYRIAICSTSNEKAVNLIADTLIGNPQRPKIDAIFAGDVVSRKKPHPEIYNLASSELGCLPENCVVIEDSRNGYLAARAAGMKCIITKSYYTSGEKFENADIIVDELGDPPNVRVSMTDVEDILGNPII